MPYYAGMVAPRHVDWLNDPEVVKFSEQRHKKHTLESQHAYVNGIWNAPNQYMWLITNHHMFGIGTATAFVDINNNIADVGILIGDKTLWGYGYGYESWKAICDWLFEDIQVYKIEAGCMALNMPMRKLAMKYGMTIEGMRPYHFLLKDGRRTALLHMGKFNPNLESNHEDESKND